MQLPAFIVEAQSYLAQHPWLLILLALWTLTWKGLALWKSARRNERVWFIALLIINTIGLLEILYLFLFSCTEKKSDSA